MKGNEILEKQKYLTGMQIKINSTIRVKVSKKAGDQGNATKEKIRKQKMAKSGRYIERSKKII